MATAAGSMHPTGMHSCFNRKFRFPVLIWHPISAETCMYGTVTGYHVGHQQVSRCRTRGESQGMCNVTGTPPLSSNKAEPTLALKPRGDVTRSTKQGYQWPQKMDICPTKCF